MLLGWLIWRYGWVEKPSENPEEDDIEFWRARLGQSRDELWNEQATVAALRKEKENLKKRIASLEA